MRMPITFAANQVVSHGFGLFLFAALVPMMQSAVSITHWHLTAVGVFTQLAYLMGAMLVGLMGHRVSSSRLLILSGLITSLLLISIAFLHDPILILVILTVMACSAAICWGAISELVARYGRPELSSMTLSVASSGTAWGYSINGLLILWLVPTLGWRCVWVLAGMLGLTTVMFTLLFFNKLRRKSAYQPDEVVEALSVRQLARTIFTERAAGFACLICFFVGFSTLPFSTWFTTYISELSLPSSLGGYTWTVTGLTGMVAGLLAGKLADCYGQGLALFVIFGGYALSLIAFIISPADFAILAGFGYGLIYFPMWGIVAGWVSRQYTSTATMQINGIGMVAFGLGGALGNLIAGYIQAMQGSLSDFYSLITLAAALLTVFAVFILVTERKSQMISSDIRAAPTD